LPDGPNLWVLGLLVATLAASVWGAVRLLRYGPSRKPEAALDPQVPSIGGWLVLLALQLGLAPIFTLSAIAQHVKLVGSTAKWRALATARSAGGLWLAAFLLVETAFLLWLCVYPIVVLVLFGQRRRRFVHHLTALLLSVVGFTVIDLVVASQLSSRPTSTGDWAVLARAIIAAAVWIPYVRISRRSTATFVF
jgi:hypothetical protein